MTGNGAHEDGLDRLQAALSARATMKRWAEGAELVEVVRAAHDAGWLARLRDEITAEDLASDAGVPVGQVSDVLAVLVSAGVVRAGETSFRLCPAFDALVAGASGVDIRTVLDALDLARGQAGRVAKPGRLDGARALVLARDWGVRASTGARELYGLLYQALPEYRDRLARGGPLLDVGSGVGGALLTTATLFDELRAVGVEIVAETAAESRRRAREAGVASRVEIRTADARTLTDEGAFTVSYWAQAFFPADTRAEVLAAIFRALRPDGLLLMQELFPRDEPTTGTRLDQLFYRQQNLAFGLSADALVTEAAAAGFEDARILDSPVGKLVLARKPVS
ncbi:SAM-dependent methyltransferase [Amycolatopsis sp. CA-230715]|uniref:SAM-dependent methyltransferase n=1 Tax=Amycolatopsis sp. CA-230715 TaxID=2745196 RepID=UPI001C02D52C|nr:methyltransferase domain-containing protein [Amycolatopsis sp. CA-230715]QWF78122.1 hypothetical protein HUW46_01517 [Amycolatopsis sp. CA-230715]